MTDDRAAGKIVFESWDGSGAAEVWGALGAARHWTAIQGRTFLGADRDGDRFRRARVMRDGARSVVGVLAVTDNAPLHPRYLNSYIEIASDRRGAGLGRAALDQLRLLAAQDGRPVEAKAEFESVGHRFLLQNAFTEVQRTRTLRLDASLLPAPSKADDFDVQVYPSGDTAPDACVLAWQDRYIATHTWNPAALLPLAQARKYFAALPARIITVAPRRGSREILGLAFLADGEFEGCSTDPDDPRGVHVVRALIRAAAGLAGTSELLAEVDDAATTTVAAVSSLTVSVEDDSRIAVSLPAADLGTVFAGPVHLD
jgi:GNAT superfamily N-acetyltransferase